MRSAAILEPALRDWLPRKRWFGAKTRTIESLRVRSWVELPPRYRQGFTLAPANRKLRRFNPRCFSSMFTTSTALPDIYQIPLAISTGAVIDEIAANRPDSIVARLTTAAGPAILHDAVVREDFHQGLLRLIAGNATLPVSHDGVGGDSVRCGA